MLLLLKLLALLVIGGTSVSLCEGRCPKHHVIIWTRLPNGGRNCSGSIISSDWILSSASCVQESIEIEITFFRKYTNIIGNSFRVSLGPQSIVHHPNDIYDISLLKLPMQLRMEEGVEAVPLYRGGWDRLKNEIGVIPGRCNENSTSLVLRDLQMNRISFQSKYNAFRFRSKWNLGAGLYINMIKKPVLIGLSSNEIMKFTPVEPLIPWIETTIGLEVGLTIDFEEASRNYSSTREVI